MFAFESNALILQLPDLRLEIRKTRGRDVVWQVAVLAWRQFFGDLIAIGFSDKSSAHWRFVRDERVLYS